MDSISRAAEAVREAQANLERAQTALTEAQARRRTVSLPEEELRNYKQLWSADRRPKPAASRCMDVGPRHYHCSLTNGHDGPCEAWSWSTKDLFEVWRRISG